MIINLQFKDEDTNHILTSVIIKHQSLRDAVEAFKTMLITALVKGSLTVESNELEHLTLNGVKIQTSENKNKKRADLYLKTGS